MGVAVPESSDRKRSFRVRRRFQGSAADFADQRGSETYLRNLRKSAANESFVYKTKPLY
jgi:hypothetical protein